MENISLVQDIAILLLAAGIAGIIFKKIGLSVIVGYLIAGVIIGPNTPMKMITDEHRIEELAQIGLVFVMFSVGLHLSLTKLRKMGMATIIATALGAIFMLHFTLFLGSIVEWTPMQSLFVAAMLMVSSSAVIAKIMEEMHLTHNRTAQMALGITIVEDIVAVLMLTLLASKTTGQGGSIGITGIIVSAFIVLLLILGLLIIPKIVKRIDMEGDTELRTIIVAGLLLFVALVAVKAHYSLALGAFLFGAIIAELPQKESIEKSFDSVRSIFSSIFFVAIGMMISPELLLENWKIVLALGVFSLFVRPIACGLALMIVGVPIRDAKRGGMLLTPLGEFTFIIAMAGISANILDQSFYPIAVALSIFTVFATPILNRFAEPILNFSEKIEPNWLKRLINAYQSWLKQILNRPPTGQTWAKIRPKLIQIAIEVLLVTGLLIFSRPLLGTINAQLAESYPDSHWLTSNNFNYIFWAAIGLLSLIPTLAIWRNVSAITTLIARRVEQRRIPQMIIEQGIKAAAGIAIIYWLYALLPIATFTRWGWIAFAIITIIIIVFFSRKLIYWHESWQESVSKVLEKNEDDAEARAQARESINHALEDWQLSLQECIVPGRTEYAGKNLRELSIPNKFGCSVIEIERNGQHILTPGPETILYHGDKILLLGKKEEVLAGKDFLEKEPEPGNDAEESFSMAILECARIENDSPHVNKSFAELDIVRKTGARVVGIQRGQDRIISPSGKECFQPGDDILIIGTLKQIKRFNQWLNKKPAKESQ